MALAFAVPRRACRKEGAVGGHLDEVARRHRISWKSVIVSLFMIFFPPPPAKLRPFGYFDYKIPLDIPGGTQFHPVQIPALIRIEVGPFGAVDHWYALDFIDAAIVPITMEPTQIGKVELTVSEPGQAPFFQSGDIASGANKAHLDLKATADRVYLVRVQPKSGGTYGFKLSVG